ncbi:MAG: hypothetical protein Unbinned5434contig1000_37 [Prokaryotic dsDNA virus sp.]|jgi:hypothetical protein|nr:MAG: hypothetical protein Unbinned5434contig1000_37 [Prokaryotic dsDNA virus sp.]|tara:strand:- start:2884 stop:3264 length:381 start_codon:yes stop_codon:yes gene_type:complete
MTNKQRGYIDLTIGGKKRTLHFSMNFWSEFTEQLNIPLQDIGLAFENGISLKGLRALIYSAILANDQEKGNVIDYTIFDVGNWLDDLTPEKINKVVEAMLESKILGNSISEQNQAKPKKVTPSKTK